MLKLRCIFSIHIYFILDVDQSVIHTNIWYRRVFSILVFNIHGAVIGVGHMTLIV